MKQRDPWLVTATRTRPEANGSGSQHQMSDATDHIREAPIGAAEMLRTICKERLHGLVTTFTNMELKIRVKRFTRTTEAIADYFGRKYSKEMRLVVKNQKENISKEPVMPGKEETKPPFMMKKYEKI